MYIMLNEVHYAPLSHPKYHLKYHVDFSSLWTLRRCRVSIFHWLPQVAWDKFVGDWSFADSIIIPLRWCWTLNNELDFCSKGVEINSMLTTQFRNQTHFPKREKDLVNCVYKPCPTGMQSAGWHNQISNNTLLNYLLQSKHATWEV